LKQFPIYRFWSEDFLTNGELLLPVIISLAMFFAFAAIVLVVITLIHRGLWNIRFLKAQKLQIKYENYLAELVSGTYDDSLLHTMDQQQKSTLALGLQDITQPFNRNILRGQILLLHQNVFGKDAGRIRELYLSLGFKDEALQRLKSSRWKIIVEAIKELEQMGIREAHEPIFQLIHHRNKTVKTAAIRAKVHLDTSPLSFLDDYTTVLTDWQQSNIAYALLRVQRTDIPDFTQWYDHDNDTVLAFAIKMCGLFNQGQAAKPTAALLSHSNISIKKTAIKTLSLIGTTTEIPALIQAYAASSDLLKPDILTALQLLSKDTEIPFFETQLQHKDNDIRLAAAQSMARLGTASRQRLEFLFDQADKDLKQVITHALKTK